VSVPLSVEVSSLILALTPHRLYSKLWWSRPPVRPPIAANTSASAKKISRELCDIDPIEQTVNHSANAGSKFG